jgi:uncharacterized protein (DUF1684 family)
MGWRGGKDGGGWTGRRGPRGRTVAESAAAPANRPASRPAGPARPVLSVLLAALLLTAACSSRPPEDKNYAAKIATDRAQKDASFEKSSDSPIPADKRRELLPLTYFPIDPDYNVPAILRPTDDRTVIDMPTSTGTQRKMRRVGSLEFTLKGQRMKLTAFVEVGAPNLDHLFVPFSDLTSGTETYPGGRYIDLDRNATGIYEIDFNRAYFPYCYYNPTYECPYPPPENRLKVPIRAGEKLKHSNA